MTEEDIIVRSQELRRLMAEEGNEAALQYAIGFIADLLGDRQRNAVEKLKS